MAELARAGKLREALAISERYVKPGTRDADFLRNCAVLEKQLGNAGAALHWALAAEAITTHPDTLMIIARGDMRAGRTDASVDRCQKILQADPDHLPALLLLAEALESAVRTDQAWQVLEQLRAHAPRMDALMLVRAEHMRAAVLVHQGHYAQAIELLDRAVLSSTDHQPQLRRSWFLRAKACDRVQRYDEAFASATKANALQHASFEPDLYQQAVEQLMHFWTRDAMAHFPTSECGSEVPVFIAGMPRSGTSLLDQVIDAHSQAAGVGEVKGIEQFAMQLEQGSNLNLPAPECFGLVRDRAFKNAAQAYLLMCNKLAPGAKCVVNKALSNNRILGLVARLFPRTRIIHSLRDPRDVAVSCFMGGFNSNNYPWTSRIDWIASAWTQSQRLMQHWKHQLDLPILDAHYEQVVTDPDTEFPRIITFLGLEWQEGCARFYQSKRTVRTLSYDQVNRPLYATSVNRWQHYEKFLASVQWPAYP